jgi:hypothetical protein
MDFMVLVTLGPTLSRSHCIYMWLSFLLPLGDWLSVSCSWCPPRDVYMSTTLIYFLDVFFWSLHCSYIGSLERDVLSGGLLEKGHQPNLRVFLQQRFCFVGLGASRGLNKFILSVFPTSFCITFTSFIAVCGVLPRRMEGKLQIRTIRLQIR